MEGTNPQHAGVEYGDNGELDLNYGGDLLEAEQEPETSPHSAPAAYKESPPPRLVARPQSSAKSHQDTCPGLNQTSSRRYLQDQQAGVASLTSLSPCYSSALFLPATICQQQSRASWQAAAVRPATAAQSSLSLRQSTFVFRDNPEHISAHAGMYWPDFPLLTVEPHTGL